MLVLLAAATVAVSPPSNPPTARMPNLYNPPARCGAMHDEVTRRISTATRGRPALLHYAVLREVGGCPVPSPAGYHPDYLLPGAADAARGRPAIDRPADGTPR